MKHLIIVTGLGRCGSSLAMQMLRAGGVPCLGEWPAFEEPQAEGMKIEPHHAGHAVKVIDPLRRELSSLEISRALPIRWVCLRRRPLDQARSMAKLLAVTMGAPPAGARQLRKVSESVRRDHLELRRALAR